MTVEHIIPCICVPHPPTAADKTIYGMPILRVSNSNSRHEQFYYFECPVCHRGGILTSYKSAYHALKAWNKMQEHQYHCNNREILYYDDFDKYTDKLTGQTLTKYKSKWDDI